MSAFSTKQSQKLWSNRNHNRNKQNVLFEIRQISPIMDSKHLYKRGNNSRAQSLYYSVCSLWHDSYVYMDVMNLSKPDKQKVEEETKTSRVLIIIKLSAFEH